MAIPPEITPLRRGLTSAYWAGYTISRSLKSRCPNGGEYRDSKKRYARQKCAFNAISPNEIRL